MFRASLAGNVLLLDISKYIAVIGILALTQAAAL